MSTSRIQKYQNYRNSLIKEDVSVLSSSENINSFTNHQDVLTTTSALPMDEVLGTLQEKEQEDIFIKRNKRKQILKMILIFSVAFLALLGIIITGVWLFRGM